VLRLATPVKETVPSSARKGTRTESVTSHLRIKPCEGIYSTSQLQALGQSCALAIRFTVSASLGKYFEGLSKINLPACRTSSNRFHCNKHNEADRPESAK
jgi:hypothetical protein